MYKAYFRGLAFAGGSVIGVSRVTGTREAALGVSAAATSTTTSVVRCTLVDICVITYQLTQLVYSVIIRAHVVDIGADVVTWLHQLIWPKAFSIKDP